MRDAGVAKTRRIIQILGVTGNCQDWNGTCGGRLLEGATEFETVHSGNREVGHHGIGPLFTRLFESLETVMSVDDPEARPAQVLAVHQTQTAIVLDNQHQWVGGVLLGGRHP